MRLLATVTATFAAVQQASALPIEEHDKEILYCMHPVEPASLQRYLSDKLVPETLDGHAWVTTMIFNVDSLKLVTPVGALPIGGDAELVKLSANVLRTDTFERGYLLMNLDFPSSAQGWVQKMGCSATQPGVKCGATDARASREGTARVDKTYDAAKFDAAFKVSDQAADPKLVDFAVNRGLKILQDGSKGTVRSAKQEKKSPGETPSNYEASMVELTSLHSTLFATRWPQLKVDETQGSARCFWGPSLLFVDHSADPVAEIVV